jgi:hypothetical protein
MRRGFVNGRIAELAFHSAEVRAEISRQIDLLKEIEQMDTRLLQSFGASQAVDLAKY